MPAADNCGFCHLTAYPHGVYNANRTGKRGILMEHECCNRTKLRTEEETRSLIHRLSRIEGQVRGLKGMVEKNAYCVDILTQSAAVTAALNAFNRELLADHIRTCVAEGIRAGDDEKIEELITTLQKLMKL